MADDPTPTLEEQINNVVELHVMGAHRVWYDDQSSQWMCITPEQTTRPVRNYCTVLADALIAKAKVESWGATFDFTQVGAEWLAVVKYTYTNRRGREVTKEVGRDQDATRQMAGACACIKAIRHPLGDEL